MRPCHFGLQVATRRPTGLILLRSISHAPAGDAAAGGQDSAEADLRQSAIECIKGHMARAEREADAPRRLRKSADIILQGYSQPLLDGFTSFLLQTRSALGGSGPGPHTPRVHIQKWSVLSSPFAHKTAFTQFERRTHQRKVQVFGLHPELTKRLIWYLQQHAPPDIQIECRLHEYIPLRAFLLPIDGKKTIPC